MGENERKFKSSNLLNYRTPKNILKKGKKEKQNIKRFRLAQGNQKRLIIFT